MDADRRMHMHALRVVTNFTSFRDHGCFSGRVELRHLRHRRRREPVLQWLLPRGWRPCLVRRCHQLGARADLPGGPSGGGGGSSRPGRVLEEAALAQCLVLGYAMPHRKVSNFLN